MIITDKDPLPPLKRQSWLRGTTRSLGARIKEKFKLGEAQYGCDFGTQTAEYLIDQIEQEAIDTLMYVRELRRRIQANKTHNQEIPPL